MNTNELTEIINTTVTDFFKALDANPQVVVSHNPESEYFEVQIDTDTPGLYIGYRGETLAALQQMLSLMLKKSTGEWQKITINVGDYREQRQATLTQLANNAAKRVEFSGEEYIFTNLSAPERRMVHMALQDHPKVTSESRGEGRNRQLVITLKN